METTPKPTPEARPPLTRERILDAAVALADAGGIAALSMRKLADALGVEAMSLYHHVANKDAILDGMVDRVFAEIALPADALPADALPADDVDWQTAMRRRAADLRAALLRHPWALGLMDSRPNPGPATLRHHDAVLKTLRQAGFSVAMAAHAFSVLDSYIYGFVLQERSLPFDTPEELEAVAAGMLAQLPADAYPHLAELTREHVLKPGYAYADEFAFGLELILEGLERLREEG